MRHLMPASLRQHLGQLLWHANQVGRDPLFYLAKDRCLRLYGRRAGEHIQHFPAKECWGCAACSPEDGDDLWDGYCDGTGIVRPEFWVRLQVYEQPLDCTVGPRSEHASLGGERSLPLEDLDAARVGQCAGSKGRGAGGAVPVRRQRRALMAADAE